MKLIQGKHYLEISDFQDWEVVEASTLEGGKFSDHCKICGALTRGWCRVSAAAFCLLYQSMLFERLDKECRV